MKGIILAGGNATRLYPSTLAISKHLLPIYDKPMIYYPLSILMLAGIRDISIITTETALPLYKALLKDGSWLGLQIKYKIQDKPSGIGEAFILEEDFIKNQSVCLILGDNLFYGQGLPVKLREATNLKNGAKIFGYRVKDPERYGVAEISEDHKKVLSIEEKPLKPKSNYAVTGLYFFDSSVTERAKSLAPSGRGELEITDIIRSYLNEDSVEIELLSRGVAWLDTGTHDSLLEASNFIAAMENRQGLKVACIEEIAYSCGYIGKEELLNITSSSGSSTYNLYLKNLLAHH